MATVDKKKLVEEELREDELDQATGGRGGSNSRTPGEIVRTQD